MKLSDLPTKFNIPFGSSAGGAFIRNIPQASQIGITAGAASLTDGFPPLTFLPIGAGGVPPFGQDFNGILKQITQWNRWAAAGGDFAVPWDITFAAAIGGYPKGALVQGASFGQWWLCTADDNTTNPDAGGAGWMALAFGQQPTFTTLITGSGNYNPQANIPFVGAVCKRVRVRMCGGGASGGVAPTNVNGNNGALSSFGSWTANGGAAGLGGLVSAGIAANIAGGAGGTGGSNGTGTLVRRISGGAGADGAYFLHNAGSLGSALTYSVLSPGGFNLFGGGPNKTPAANTGAGSAGVGSVAPANTQSGQMSSGGGAGEYVEFIVPVTSAVIAYVVGAGGAAPAGGIAGAAGAIEIEEQYQ